MGSLKLWSSGGSLSQSQETKGLWQWSTSSMPAVGSSPPSSSALATSTSSLAQQAVDLQQLCHRQQWQANAEKVLGELQEAKASMALHQSLMENLIGERA